MRDGNGYPDLDYLRYVAAIERVYAPGNSAKALQAVYDNPYRTIGDTLICHYCSGDKCVELYTVMDKQFRIASTAYECGSCGLAYEKSVRQVDGGEYTVVSKLNKRMEPRYPYAMNPDGAEDEDPVVRRFALLEVEK